jgi:hypothetical protein
VVERIRDNCEITSDGCWLWLGYRDPGGYGRTKVGSRRDGSRRSVLCHIATWEAIHGPTPSGMELDHFVCDREQCANPDHVKPVTPRENTLRSSAVTAHNAFKTACPKCGGDYTVKPNGHRYCRPCYLAYLRSYNAKRSARRG